MVLTVKSDSFEGPFDVLLELVRQKKLDVTAISIGAITQDFLSYMAREPIESAQKAHFLAIGATLLLFKLRQIMPVTPLEEVEMNEFTERLAVYQQYREAGEHLGSQWQQAMLFAGIEQVPPTERPLSLAPADLHDALQRLLVKLKSTSEAPRRHLRPPRMSLQECYAKITERLRRLSTTSFEELLPQADSYTRAVTLLTVMELHRQGSVTATQSAPFMPITVESL